VILEPFQNCGGNIPPPPGYFKIISDICSQSGTLLILDEVITGFGRLGNWFGAETYQIKADVLVCGKGLTSGYESLGAVITRKEIADTFLGSEDQMFYHGATFGGRPAAAAAALECLGIIKEENLLKNVGIQFANMKELLNHEVRGIPIVGEIRGQGLLFGIDLCKPHTGDPIDDPEFLEEISNRLFRRGLICYMHSTRSEPLIELAPPLIITSQEVKEIVGILKEVLSWGANYYSRRTRNA
jgi:adenosylmethionine-8-amino-7-oxononanoate aminotransferase